MVPYIENISCRCSMVTFLESLSTKIFVITGDGMDSSTGDGEATFREGEEGEELSLRGVLDLEGLLENLLNIVRKACI